MRKFFLVAVLVLVAGGAQGSSYLDIFGTVHDPILTTGGAVHSYSGPDLSPGISGSDNTILWGANLAGANLTNVDLSYTLLGGADLSGADLSGANLDFTNLSGADLSGADLSGAYLRANIYCCDTANFNGVNFDGATFGFMYFPGILGGFSLIGATNLGSTSGIAIYEIGTDFTGAWADGGSIPFDPVAAGWLISPEPSTALLLGLGLVGMATRRRV